MAGYQKAAKDPNIPKLHFNCMMRWIKCPASHLPKNLANLCNGYLLSIALRKTDFHRIRVRSAYFGAQQQVTAEPLQAMIGHMNLCSDDSNLTAHQSPYDLCQEMRVRDQNKYESTVSSRLHTSIVIENVNITSSLGSHAIVVKFIWLRSKLTSSSGD